MLAVGMSSLCYIVGLLITNLHLASFGIYSVEFLRGEYLLTGAVLIFLVAVTWSFLQYAIISTKVKYLLDKRSSKKWYLAFRISFLISIFFYLEISVFKPLTSAQFSPNNTEWWGGVGVLILFAGIFELLIREFSSYLRIGKVHDVSDSLEISKSAMETYHVAFFNKSPLILPIILFSLLLSLLQFYTQLLFHTCKAPMEAAQRI